MLNIYTKQHLTQSEFHEQNLSSRCELHEPWWGGTGCWTRRWWSWPAFTSPSVSSDIWSTEKTSSEASPSICRSINGKLISSRTNAKLSLVYFLWIFDIRYGHEKFLAVSHCFCEIVLFYMKMLEPIQNATSRIR